MLVVIGIIVVLSGVVLFFDFTSYRGDAFRAEVGNLGVALQTARANALNNINQQKHGVAIHPGGYDGYIVFEGNTYATADHARDVTIAATYGVTFDASSPSEIVFDQLSGNANYDGVVTMIDTQRNMQALISINHEGLIGW